MSHIKKIIFLFIVTFLIETNLSAQTPYFIDFQKILNESAAGKKAQDELKKRLNNSIKKLDTTQKNLQDQEKKIIQQKKIISAEEYKKKVDILRKDVSELRVKRSNALQIISKQRAKAKTEILKNLNPIIQKYMQEKQIRMVLNKKDIILADDKLDITKDVMDLLNKKIKSINFD
jgi:outer membrane protein